MTALRSRHFLLSLHFVCEYLNIRPPAQDVVPAVACCVRLTGIVNVERVFYYHDFCPKTGKKQAFPYLPVAKKTLQF